jgi:anti-anti-sigma regulatory factor
VAFGAISVTHVDTAGLDALADLSQPLQRGGVELRLAAVKDYLVPSFDSSGTTGRIGRDHFYPTVAAAVAT